MVAYETEVLFADLPVSLSNINSNIFNESIFKFDQLVRGEKMFMPRFGSSKKDPPTKCFLSTSPLFRSLHSSRRFMPWLVGHGLFGIPNTPPDVGRSTGSSGPDRSPSLGVRTSPCRGRGVVIALTAEATPEASRN